MESPVSPHDGSLTDSTYTVGDSQITVDGVGAFLGIAKATNGAELGSLEDAVPASRTYDVIEFADDGLSMTIQIGVGNGVWQFKLSKYNGTDPVSALGTGIDKVLNIGEVIDFESETADYGLTDFGGVTSSIVADPTDSSNKVVSITKNAGSDDWAGTSVASGSIFYPLTSSETGITVRVWSPAAGVQVKIKLEESGDTSKHVETDAVTSVSSGWETLTFDFRNHSEGTPALNTSYVFDNLIIYMNYGVVGSDEVYYFDDIKFIGAVPLDVTASSLVGNWKMAPEAGAFVLVQMLEVWVNGTQVAHLMSQHDHAFLMIYLFLVKMGHLFKKWALKLGLKHGREPQLMDVVYRLPRIIRVIQMQLMLSATKTS